MSDGYHFHMCGDCYRVWGHTEKEGLGCSAHDCPDCESGEWIIGYHYKRHMTQLKIWYRLANALAVYIPRAAMHAAIDEFDHDTFMSVTQSR